MEHFESRLLEIGGKEALKRAQQRLSMRGLRARAAEAGYDPARWARATVWDARRRAKKAGMSVIIDHAWVAGRLAMIGGCCEISGIPFSAENPTQGHKRPFMPSLDRIDCTKGYLPDNVRIVCVAVNTLLQDWGVAVYERLLTAHQNPIRMGVEPTLDTLEQQLTA